MVRPTFIIAEPAPGEGLSSRKLVIETAYFNVLTAYSGPELLEIIPRFPNADAVIVHTGLPKLDIHAVQRHVREKMPHAKLVALAQTSSFVANGLDAVISSHDPQQLLGFLEEQFGRLQDVRQAS
jgi:hypothetical protein